MKRSPPYTLHLCLSGSIGEIVDAVVSSPMFDTDPPKFEVDMEVVDAPAKWRAKLSKTKSKIMAMWPDDPNDEYAQKVISVDPRWNAVIIAVPHAFATVDEAIEILESLPFDVCSIGNVRGRSGSSPSRLSVISRSAGEPPFVVPATRSSSRAAGSTTDRGN